jgi:hypothetical protein
MSSPPSPPTSSQHGLALLLLFVTILAVVGGIALLSPGLGIAAAIVAIPVLVRVYASTARTAKRKEPATAVSTFVGCMAGLAMAVTVVVAAAAAFFFTCLSVLDAAPNGGPEGGHWDSLILPGIALGGVAAVVVGVVLVGLYRMSLCRRDDR